MLSTKEKGILLYIINYCKRIENKVHDLSYDDFVRSQDVIEIVCFNIFQIGELAKGLSNEFVDKHDRIPWKYIKGMRDRIGHGYGSLDLKQVWNTATNDVKPLMDYCETIIDESQQN